MDTQRNNFRFENGASALRLRCLRFDGNNTWWRSVRRLVSKLINELWMTSGLWKRASFLRATKDVRATQSNYLRKLLVKNQDSDFGRTHSFRQRDVEAYQQNVPVRSYEELVPWIEALASGRSAVLTADAVRFIAAH